MVMKRLVHALPVMAMLLGASNAAAEEVYDSPSGPVRIIEMGIEKAVAVGDRVFPLDTLKAYVGERVGNLFLIYVDSGGNLCPRMFAWLDTTPGDVHITGQFGTCSEAAEVSTDGDVVRVTQDSFNPSEGTVAFDYDGQTVTRRVLGLESSEVAQAAAGNVDAWIGQGVFEYLRAAETEADLIKAFGWDDLDLLRKSAVVSSPDDAFKIEGEWVVGSGCRPHMCNSDAGALAIHRQTGALLGALKENHQTRLIGSPAGPLPNTIREMLTGS